MSCNYCTLEISTNGNIRNGELIYCSDFVSVGIHRNDRENLLVEGDDFESFIKIKFCPMCGENLKNNSYKSKIEEEYQHCGNCNHNEKGNCRFNNYTIGVETEECCHDWSDTFEY